MIMDMEEPGCLEVGFGIMSMLGAGRGQGHSSWQGWHLWEHTTVLVTTGSNSRWEPQKVHWLLRERQYEEHDGGGSFYRACLIPELKIMPLIYRLPHFHLPVD